jgi:hypothetical protein
VFHVDVDVLAIDMCEFECMQGCSSNSSALNQFRFRGRLEALAASRLLMLRLRNDDA